jgi:3-oxoacyl-[acyl-carrier-protein] synthase III
MLMKILTDLKINTEKNLYNIDKLANTIGATIPSVLAEDWKRVAVGDIISAVAFGGGITSGRLLIKKL